MNILLKLLDRCLHANVRLIRRQGRWIWSAARLFFARFDPTRLSAEQVWICQQLGVTPEAYRRRAIEGVHLDSAPFTRTTPAATNDGSLCRREKPHIRRHSGRWSVTVPGVEQRRRPDGSPFPDADFTALAPTFSNACHFARKATDWRLAHG